MRIFIPIAGTIPVSFGCLIALQNLNLQVNSFYGNKDCYILLFIVTLFDVFMVGTIPSSVGLMVGLNTFEVHYNCLNGMKLLICIW